MPTRDQLERRVAKSDSMGLIVYALTLVGELPCAFVRGWLVGVAFGVADFIATGSHSFPDIGPVRVIAAFAPLVWSLTAFLYPLGTAWRWAHTEGARRPSERELTESTRALTTLAAKDPTVRGPRHLYVLDDNSPNAAVTADAVMLHRGLVDSGWLECLLAHELFHLNSLDGKITAARNRLVLKRNTTKPIKPARTALGMILQLATLLARGGSGLLLTRGLWGAWDRSREYLADQYAARLGQAADLKEFLETEALLYDRPAPYGWLQQNSHPPTELRIEALTTPWSSPALMDT